ncbi:MAG TPA: alpha/beta hydrolase [Candidatus Limnocylindrales bacterium]|nr:alpha/beta hydrolase [Candidatus Limnocylindrales bacterium]
MKIARHAVLVIMLGLLAVSANSQTLPQPPVKQGAYRLDGGTVYVGLEAEPPDHPTIQFYDAKTRRIGTLEHISGHEYRTDGSPAINFVLDSPTSPVVEKPFVIGNGPDRLGASLWHASGAEHLSTIVLIHGADDEMREMGFLIPYFVSHGLNVVTYDQRGTGESAGNWRYTGPDSKADDVVAILHKVESDRAVDAHRIGVWGFSNGGWVAPIVATRFPLAFMILKSAPSETIAENVLYEIGQDLREHGRFTEEQISTALAFERIMFLALKTNSNWSAAGEALNAAKKEPWFPYMRIPPGMTAPPPPPILAALRAALIYDPAATLGHVRTPTLAVFGALDKNVDSADSAARFRKAFARAGMKDLTILTFQGAGHTLVRSMTGYEDDPSLPERTVDGYPEAIVRWLAARGFTK